MINVLSSLRNGPVFLLMAIVKEGLISKKYGNVSYPFYSSF